MKRSGKSGRKALLAVLLALSMIFGTNSGFVYATEGAGVPDGAAPGQEEASTEDTQEPVTEEVSEEATEEAVGEGASAEPEEPAEPATEETEETLGDSDVSGDQISHFNDPDPDLPAGAIAITEEAFPDPVFRKAICDGILWDQNESRTVRPESTDNGTLYFPANMSEGSYSLDLRGNKYTGLRSLKGLELIPGIDSLRLQVLPEVSELPGLKETDKLTHLTLRNVGLNSLDVSGMSNLYGLSLENMEGYGLDSLDLSGNINLVSLDLQKVHIEDLDLSHNTKLEFLTIESSSLPGFNIEGLTTIENLRLEDFHLGSLDVSGLTELISLDVSRCSFDDGNLEFDLDRLNKFSELKINDSNIKKVTLSGNSMMNVSLKNCEELEEVDLKFDEHNSYGDSKIDCSYCTALKKVNIHAGVADHSIWVDVPNKDYNFLGCKSLEEVNIGIGEGEVSTVSANITYDFRYVTQNFDADKFNIQTETDKPERGTITVKATKGSWIANNINSGNGEDKLTPTEMYIPRSSEDAFTGDVINLYYRNGDVEKTGRDWMYYYFENRQKVTKYTTWTDGDGIEHVDEWTERVETRIPESDAPKIQLSTSNAKVAAVDNNAKTIRMTGPGTATITIAGSGTTLKKTLTLRVTNKVTGVTVNPDSISLMKGTSATVKATVAPASGAGTAVWWHVYDEDENELTTDSGITVKKTGQTGNVTTATISVEPGTASGNYIIRAASMSNKDADDNFITGQAFLTIKGLVTNTISFIFGDPVSKVEYCDDNKSWKTYSEPFSSTNDRTLYFRATLAQGQAGNYDIKESDIETTGIAPGSLKRTGADTGKGIYTFKADYTSVSSASLKITPKKVYTAKITTIDADKGITTLQYSVDNGTTWAAYPAAGVARVRDGETFRFRFKAPDDYRLEVKAGSDVVIPDPTSDGYKECTIALTEDNKDISIGAYLEERYFKLSNTTANLTGETVKVDSGSVGSAYFADTKQTNGVLKDGTTGYRVFDKKGANYVTMTVKATSGHAPTLSIVSEDNSSLLDIAYDPASVISGKNITEKKSGDVVQASIEQNSKTLYTISFRKDVLSPYDTAENKRNISYVTIGEKNYDGGLIKVSKDSVKVSASGEGFTLSGNSIDNSLYNDHFTITMAANGRVLDKKKDGQGKFVGFIATDNAKVTVTVTPDNGYVVDAASLTTDAILNAAVANARKKYKRDDVTEAEVQ